MGKQRDKGLKVGGQSHVNSWLVSRLVWPCSVLDQHSLSCLLIKLHFYFRGCRALFCVHSGLRGQQPEWDHGITGAPVCGVSSWSG